MAVETSWDKAYKLSEQNEGGISTDRDDTGNFYEVDGKNNFVATRYGQTFVNWLGSSKKKKPTTQAEFDSLKEEFEKVTVDDVKKSFKTQYWNKYNLDKIKDDKVAANIYDAMINQEYTLGGKGTHSTLADVLNELGYDVDGATDFGTNKKAVDALNKAIDEKGAEAVNTAYSNRREESYMGSGTVPKHGQGWLKRLNVYREPEDQYSNEQLEQMQFSNDSTSNLNVLKEIRGEAAAEKQRQNETDFTDADTDLNVAPDGESNQDKLIRLKLKAKKNAKHDLTTGPSPYELNAEELQYIEDADNGKVSDVDPNEAALVVLNDGDKSIINAAEVAALEDASAAATGLSEVVTNPDTGEIEVVATPEGTTGKTEEAESIEVQQEQAEDSIEKAEIAKKLAEEKAIIDRIRKEGVTDEDRQAALDRHNARVEALMEEYSDKDGKDGKDGQDGGGGLTDLQQQKRMRAAEKALTGLKAAAGITSLSKALRDPEVDVPELSPLIQEAVDKQRQLSKTGLTAQEKGAAMQNLNNAYAGAMKNVLRASGGQRGMFLAGQGAVDANRIQGLNQLAAQDAAVRRQNIEGFNNLATRVGQMQLSRDMTAEQMKQQAMAQNRQLLGGIGTNLLSDALSDVSYYVNPNRDLIDQATTNALKSIGNIGNDKYDSENADYTVTSNNSRKKKTKE